MKAPLKSYDNFKCQFHKINWDKYIKLVIISKDLDVIYRGWYICKFCKYLIRLDTKHYLELRLDLS